MQRAKRFEDKSDSICNLGHPGIVGKDTLATGAFSWDHDRVSRSGLLSRVAASSVLNSHHRLFGGPVCAKYTPCTVYHIPSSGRQVLCIPVVESPGCRAVLSLLSPPSTTCVLIFVKSV